MVLTQKDRKLRQQPRSTQRPVRSNQGAKEKCTLEKFTHNFLRHQFPILTANPEVLILQQQREQQFFYGLQELSRQFGYIPPDIKNVGYPYNLHIVLHDANVFLNMKKIRKQLRFFRLDDDTESLCLVSVYDTETTLYYLALEPLWQIRNSPVHQLEAALLTSVLAYFCQVLQIPSYTRGDSVSMYYDMIHENLIECKSEFEPEDYRAHRAELSRAKKAGAQMIKVLSNPLHLKLWEKRMNTFKPADEWSASVLQLAKSCFQLYLKYPDQRFDRNFCREALRQHSDYFLYADQFISFVWSYDGWLFNELKEFVYNDTSNCDSMDEPVLIEVLDCQGGRKISNGKFEAEMFAAMNQLAEVLDSIYAHFKTS